MLLRKQRRHSVPTGPAKRQREILAIIHAYLKSQLPRLHNGYCYWLVLVDNASRSRFIYFLESKDETAITFQTFVIWAKRVTNKKPLVFHNDKGGEFVSQKVLDFCEKRGIRCKFTEIGKPYQNGIAEQANFDIGNSATTLLTEAKLAMTFWPEAVSTCVHTFNRSHTSALTLGETPYS